MGEHRPDAADPSGRALRAVYWVGGTAIAAVQVFVHRNVVNPDGLSYLDIASAYLAGDPRSAVNPYWGPLYSWILTAALWLTHPSARWESVIVHGVNLGIFVASLAAFDFFLRSLLAARRAHTPPDATPVLSDRGVVLLGYGAFLYATLQLIGLALVTPDLCVAALLFLAAGLALRLQEPAATWGTAAAFGVTLALAYFAKSVMFPLALVFLAAQFLTRRGAGRNLQRLGDAAALFLALSALLVVPISAATGSTTFGTSGALTYGFEVLDRPFTDWQGDSTAGSSTPVHPPRRIYTQPDIYEYTAHLRGSYPPWFDPSWWNAGSRVEFRPAQQVVQLQRNLAFYVKLFLGSAAVAATLLAVLLWAFADRRPTLQLTRALTPVLVPALAALVIYLPINLRERYVGGSAALLWTAAAAAAVRRRAGPSFGIAAERAAALCAVALVAPVAVEVGHDWLNGRGEPDDDVIVADALRTAGLRPGDRVAHVGNDRYDDPAWAGRAYWARLAGVQLVASMPDGDGFWCADSSVTRTILARLASVGARAIITHAIPVAACAEGWTRIGSTEYYFRPVTPPGDAEPAYARRVPADPTAGARHPGAGHATPPRWQP